jgi:hypothetical protein
MTQDHFCYVREAADQVSEVRMPRAETSVDARVSKGWRQFALFAEYPVGNPTVFTEQQRMTPWLSEFLPRERPTHSATSLFVVHSKVSDCWRAYSKTTRLGYLKDRMELIAFVRVLAESLG